MFILHRCHICGDLCTQRQDGMYLCDSLDCEAAQLFMWIGNKEVG